MTKRLKHEALLRALLDGAQIQWKHNISGEWHAFSSLVAAASSCIINNNTDLELRVKPEIKVTYRWHNVYKNGAVGSGRTSPPDCARTVSKIHRGVGLMKMTLENDVPVSTEFIPNKENV